ncbi:SRPBCC family protein [Stieleria sp. JC731]|uniref:SRPBCC family protein n=1 Tax=Pirellulaceae TaxID=2691357 RepID=UPI001E3D7410|nr:SRPBCC family protein [Stieleria sp. JC731]MCC9599114.1 SRPBCC family protein [Stieleria sp. JC731]
MNDTAPSKSVGNTVRLHRVFKAPVEKLYRAFTDADALVYWSAPFGFVAKMHEFDVKVGGGYKMSFVNFGTGAAHAFSVKFVEVVPNERLRYTDQFDDPNLPGTIEVTVEMKSVACGSELNIVQSGLPDVIPVEMCYLGWQESLTQLANLVEPVIPDGPPTDE